MKCWELTSLSSSPQAPAVHTKNPSNRPVFFFIYSTIRSNCNRIPTWRLRRELAHAAASKASFDSQLLHGGIDIVYIEVRCRVVVISQGLQAICRRSLDDRSAQSRYR